MPDVDSTRRQGLCGGGGIRSWGRALRKGISTLTRESSESSPPSTMRTQLEGTSMKRKQALTRLRVCLHLGLPSLQNHEKDIFCL